MRISIQWLCRDLISGCAVPEAEQSGKGQEGGKIMSYKIAVASSDGKQVDETFGSAKRFLIYEVEGEAYEQTEEQVFQPRAEDGQSISGEVCSQGGSHPGERPKDVESGVNHGCGGNGCGCGSGKDCGPGAGQGCGNGHGCGGMSEKVELVLGCRCVICKKIGFQVVKQLERKGISYFDVSCSVEEALSKVTGYFYKLDNHKSLRGNMGLSL